MPPFVSLTLIKSRRKSTTALSSCALLSPHDFINILIVIQYRQNVNSLSIILKNLISFCKNSAVEFCGFSTKSTLYTDKSNLYCANNFTENLPFSSTLTDKLNSNRANTLRRLSVFNSCTYK